MTDFKHEALRDIGNYVFSKARKCLEQKHFSPWFADFVPTIPDKVKAFVEHAENAERHELSLEADRLGKALKPVATKTKKGKK